MDTPYTNKQTACKELSSVSEALTERLNSLCNLYRHDESICYLSNIVWEVIDYDTNEFDAIYKFMSADCHLYKVILVQMDTLETIYQMIGTSDIMQLVTIAERALCTIIEAVNREVELLSE
jgi:hypothetical protein